MLPQLSSTSFAASNTEPLYPDRASLTLQMISVLSTYDPGPELRLQALRDGGRAIQDLLNLASRLAVRQQQSGKLPTPESVKAAISRGESVAALFAADPESLGADLQDAESLHAALLASDIDISIDAYLGYPVIVISTVDGKDNANLIWMSAEERAALNRYPDSEERDYAGYPAMVGSIDEQVTRYVCLDSHANLRIGPGALANARGVASSLIAAQTEVLDTLQSRLSAELKAKSLLLEFLHDLLAHQHAEDAQNHMARNEQALKDAEERRRWISRLALLLEVLSLADEPGATPSLSPEKKIDGKHIQY